MREGRYKWFFNQGTINVGRSVFAKDVKDESKVGDVVFGLGRGSEMSG